MASKSLSRHLIRCTDLYHNFAPSTPSFAPKPGSTAPQNPAPSEDFRLNRQSCSKLCSAHRGGLPGVARSILNGNSKAADRDCPRAPHTRRRRRGSSRGGALGNHDSQWLERRAL
eukprot:scaffold53_cov193-Pinguiococcus_pyrenoidosus.AAC.60